MRQSISRRAALTFLGSVGAASLLGANALAASVQCAHVPPPPPKFPPHTGPALGDLARAKGLMFGIQCSITSMADYGAEIYDPVYFQLMLSEKPSYMSFGTQFIFSNVASDPPNGDVLTLTKKAYNVTNTWYVADDFSLKLQAAGIGALAHALVWDSDQVRQPWLRTLAQGSSPDRRKNADLDWNIARAEDYVRIAFDKMDELSLRDPGFFKIVSVVNEPFDTYAVPGKMAYRGGAFMPPGVVMEEHEGVPGYIRDLYRLAGKLRGPKGPNKPKLILNDAGTEVDQGGDFFRVKLLKLLKMMLAEGLPLDGLGIESHLQPQMMNDPLNPDWGPFGAFLDEVADLGLEIHLTELDVFDFETSCNGRPGRTDESDRLVAMYFETYLTRALQCKAVKSVCAWDLSDRYSFYRMMDVDTWFGYDRLPKGQSPADWPKCAKMPMSAAAIACPRPDLYDERYAPKLARAAIARAFERAPRRD